MRGGGGSSLTAAGRDRTVFGPVFASDARRAAAAVEADCTRGMRGTGGLRVGLVASGGDASLSLSSSLPVASLPPSPLSPLSLPSGFEAVGFGFGFGFRLKRGGRGLRAGTVGCGGGAAASGSVRRFGLFSGAEIIISVRRSNK